MDIVPSNGHCAKQWPNSGKPFFGLMSMEIAHEPEAPQQLLSSKRFESHVLACLIFHQLISEAVDDTFLIVGKIVVGKIFRHGRFIGGFIIFRFRFIV